MRKTIICSNFILEDQAKHASDKLWFDELQRLLASFAMSTNPPLLFHKRGGPIQDFNEEPLHHRPRLPVIPDLRFEYSYLRSIQPYFKVQRVVPGPRQDIDTGLGERYEKVDAHSDKGKDKEGEQLQLVCSETIEVQWGKIIWVTTRDQVISPLLQGALWALASYYLNPFSAQLGSRMGTFVRSHVPTKEGLGAGWLRDWVKRLGITSEGGERR